MWQKSYCCRLNFRLSVALSAHNFTAVARTDVLLVKSLVTGVGKLLATTLYKSAAEQIIKINTERITLATLRKLTRESLIESVFNPKLKKVVENYTDQGQK